MDGKPDIFVRFLLFIIVCLLTVQVCIQFFYPVGRYIQMSYPGEAMVAVLDTRTGKVYIHTKDVGGVIDVVEKAKERAKQQPKDGKP